MYTKFLIFYHSFFEIKWYKKSLLLSVSTEGGCKVKNGPGQLRRWCGFHVLVSIQVEFVSSSCYFQRTDTRDTEMMFHIKLTQNIKWSNFILLIHYWSLQPWIVNFIILLCLWSHSCEFYFIFLFFMILKIKLIQWETSMMTRSLTFFS